MRENLFPLGEEFSNVPLADQRLSDRLEYLATQLGQQAGSSIPESCKTWTDIKAAYRFFSNDRVEQEKIQSTHFDRTVERIKNHAGSMFFLINDSSTLNYYSHPKTKDLGSIGNVSGKKHIPGIYFHTALACTSDGAPLGILHQNFWMRRPHKSSKKTLKKRRIEQKESFRWVQTIQIAQQVQEQTGKHLIVLGDEESDLNESIEQALNRGVGFVTRAREQRICQEANGAKIIDYLENASSGSGAKETTIEIVRRKKFYSPARKGKRQNLIPARHRGPEMNQKVTVDVRWGNVTIEVRPKIFKRVGVVFTKEKPKIGRPQFKPIRWFLVTHREVNSFEEAMEVVRIYKNRWAIEVYHQILKSGFHVEDCRLEQADRLVRYLMVMGVIAWRIQALTQLARSEPDIPSSTFLDPEEVLALNLLFKRRKNYILTLSEAVLNIAQLGGFIARKSDKNPGPKTIWRGFQSLHNIALGVLISNPERCG